MKHKYFVDGPTFSRMVTDTTIQDVEAMIEKYCIAVGCITPDEFTVTCFPAEDSV